MTTNGVVIDGEMLEPLDVDAAKALDDEIREASGTLAADGDALLKLLERAKAGKIHVALGFPSWPAYVNDVVQIVPTDKAERRMLAALMSGEGMSQRAIGAILGVDQKTVSNDLRSGEENSSAVTVGLDGKNHPRERTPHRRAITDAWSDAVSKLTKDTDRLSRISDDDRFPRNRDKLGRRSHLQRAIDKLQAVVDKLDKLGADR